MEEEKIYLTKPEKEFKEIAKNIMNVNVEISQLDKTLTYIQFAYIILIQNYQEDKTQKWKKICFQLMKMSIHK